MTAWQCARCGFYVMEGEIFFLSWRCCPSCRAWPAFHVMTVPCDGYQLRVIELGGLS